MQRKRPTVESFIIDDFIYKQRFELLGQTHFYSHFKYRLLAL